MWSLAALSLSLSEDMKQFIQQQVEQGRYANAEEYLNALIREDMRRVNRQRFEAALYRESPPDQVEMTQADWAALDWDGHGDTGFDEEARRKAQDKLGLLVREATKGPSMTLGPEEWADIRKEAIRRAELRRKKSD